MATNKDLPPPMDARDLLEAIAAAQREPEAESPKAARERFAAEVRERTASSSSKVPNAPKRTLLPARLQFASTQWKLWDVVPDHGTTVDSMLDPAYWANVARKLTPWDEIVVRAEDGSYIARFVVLERGNLYARVALLPGYPLNLQVSEPDVDSSVPSGYEVKWTGPHTRYAVARDGAKLKEGFTSKGEAAAWLREHLKGMKARVA
jgi:hypothetical protein